MVPMWEDSVVYWCIYSPVLKYGSFRNISSSTRPKLLEATVNSGIQHAFPITPDIIKYEKISS